MVNTLVYAGAIWLATLVLVRPLAPLRRLARMQRGECPGCGYDVRYDFAKGCPECGMMRAGKQGDAAV